MTYEFTKKAAEKAYEDYNRMIERISAQILSLKLPTEFDKISVVETYETLQKLSAVNSAKSRRLATEALEHARLIFGGCLQDIARNETEYKEYLERGEKDVTDEDCDGL